MSTSRPLWVQTGGMIVSLQTEGLQSLEQVRAFVEGSESVEYQPRDRESAYGFVQRTLVSFGYYRLGRAERGLIRRYIGKVCGFSVSQVTRLIRQQAQTGRVEDRRGGTAGGGSRGATASRTSGSWRK